MMKAYVRGFITVVVEHPLRTVILCVLLLSVLIAGLPGIHYYPSPRDFQGANSEPMRRLLALEAEYVQDNTYFVMFRPKDGEAQNIFTQNTLSAIVEFTDAAWRLPNVKRVDSLSNFQYSEVDGDEILVDYLITDQHALNPESIAEIKARALAEPRLVNLLVAQDGAATGVLMEFSLDIKNIEPVMEIDTAVLDLAAQIAAKYPHLEYFSTGTVSANAEWMKTIVKDVKYLYSLTLLLIVLSLLWFFRSFKACLSALSIGIFSIAGALGTTGYFGGSLHPPTTVGVLMILMLALADTIHVVSGVARHLGKGLSRKDAIIESVVSNFGAIALTSITTAIGFLSFFTSELLGTRIMGAYVAFGVMLAWFLSISLLPALLCWCDIKLAKGGTRVKAFEWLAEIIIRYRNVFLWFCLPVLGVGLYGLSLNQLDENFAKFVNKSEPLRINLAATQAHLTGVSTIIYSLDSHTAGGIADPEFMAQVDKLTMWLRGQQHVRHVSSYTDSIKNLNQNMNGGDEGNYRLPASRDLASQYLLFYEVSLPEGLDLTNQINADKSATRLVISIDDVSMLKVMSMGEGFEAWMASNTPLLVGSKANGSAVNLANLIVMNMINMVSGAMMALVVIGFILLFAFRSLLPGALSVVMVAAPIVVCFGLWGLFVGFVGLSASIALCMVIGIVVDNAVHFISKFQFAKNTEKKSPEDAVRYAFSMVGSAIFTNTMVLSLGFGVLWFSAFAINSVLGQLTVLSMMLALIGTFTLLPALLLLFGKKSKEKSPELALQR